MRVKVSASRKTCNDEDQDSRTVLATAGFHRKEDTHMERAGSLSIVAALAACITAAHAVPRQDVLECALPGGGRAVLKAGYDGSLLAKVIPAHVSKRLNQEPWEIAFDAVASRAVPRAPLSVPHGAGSEAWRWVGIIDGTPVSKMSYLGADGRWFQPDAIPKALCSSREKSPSLRKSAPGCKRWVQPRS